jgi:capsular polysaccharide biosynthesis protein
MIPAFSGRLYRLINRHADSSIQGVESTTEVIRWSDSRVIDDFRIAIYEVPKAVVSTAFTVFSEYHREVYLDTTYDWVENFFSLPYSKEGDAFRYRGCTNPCIIPGRAILIGGSPENGSWYHWNLNWAPRLSILAKLAPELLADTSIPIIFHKHVERHPFVDYLSLYGIDVSRCIFTTLDQDIFCEHLYVPTFVSQMVYAKEFLIDLAGRCIQQTESIREHPDNFGRNLFISRQHFSHPRRRISNFEDIKNTLHRHSYRNFIADNCSLSTQVEAFSSAPVLVGAHGAGLASMIFMKQGSDIVVLDSRRNIEAGHTRMFTVLGEAMGHRVFLLECDEKASAPDIVDVPHWRDLIVNPDAFTTILDKIAYSRSYRNEFAEKLCAAH